MSEHKTHRLITPIEPSLLVRIDDFRFEGRISTRSEAVRILLEQALSGDPASASSRRPAND
ncbi:hypothetical protein [Falsiroseomonas sp. CW058]|uniref:hypothetical protein n=1 Tax=Falsiroseomonas sp. CW058 TaxID=3388664 RepID=UPI003D3148E8